MCFFKLELAEKADPHTSQVNGFSPLFVRMYLFELEFIEYLDPQTLQENGFPSVCVFACVFSNFNLDEI